MHLFYVIMLPSVPEALALSRLNLKLVLINVLHIHRHMYWINGKLKQKKLRQEIKLQWEMGHHTITIAVGMIPLVEVEEDEDGDEEEDVHRIVPIITTTAVIIIA